MRYTRRMRMRNNQMQEEKWVLCPGCGGKTRTRMLEGTVLVQFPLFCPKCKREYLVNAEKGEITFAAQMNFSGQDAQTQG